jgi:hypothetical protein
VVFSLLSNCTLVLPTAVIMNPSFDAGVPIHPCTAAVASTERNVFAVEAGMPVATDAPCVRPESPVTPDSVHAPSTRLIFTVPLTFT